MVSRQPCIFSVCFHLQGQATDIAIQAEEILKLKKQINAIYAKHTKQNLDVIGKQFHSPKVEPEVDTPPQEEGLGKSQTYVLVRSSCK